MLCPTCKNVQLVMTESQGIEIDYCPTCRGVWLDRGELDKIIERAAQPLTQPTASASSHADSNHEHGGYRGHHEKRHNEHKHHDSHGRRRSIWHEIFD